MVTPQNRPQTDLQKQLVRVRDPATSRLKTAHDRYKDSFIFEAKEAAEQDLTSIYLIGLEGFNSLVQLDSRLEIFRDSLFSETSKGADRITFTKEENLELNKNIDSFLVFLGPYFLISASGKAIEWLVRRFRINEFNVDGIIQCILPYHDTQPFLKFLSILHLSTESRWSPLIGVRKSKVALSRTQIVRWLVRDPVLLKFTLEMVKKAALQTPRYSAVFSFYAAVILSYVQEIPKLTEKEVNIIVPTAIIGLKSTCNDFVLASFMVLVNIGSRVSFAKEILDTLIKCLTKANMEFNAVLGALVLLSHSQPQRFVPGSCSSELTCWLVSQKDLVVTLGAFGATQNVVGFAKYLVWGLIEAVLAQSDTTSELVDLLVSLLSVPCIAVPELVSDLCLHLFSMINTRSSEQVAPLCQLFKTLESQQSDLVQTLIAKHLGELSKGGRDNKKYTQLYSLLVGQLQDSISVPLKETDTSLASSLVHPDPRFQLAAIKKLSDLLQTHECSTYSVLFPALLNHLGSGTPEVVEAILEMLKKHPSLAKALPSDKLWELIQVLPSKFLAAGFEIILSPQFIESNIELCLAPIVDNMFASTFNLTTHEFVLKLLKEIKDNTSVMIPAKLIKSKAKSPTNPIEMATRNVKFAQAIIQSIAALPDPAVHLIEALKLFTKLRSNSARLAIVLVVSTVLNRLLKSRGFIYFQEVLIQFEGIMLEFTDQIPTGISHVATDSEVFEAAVIEPEMHVGLAGSLATTFCLSKVLGAFEKSPIPEFWLKPCEGSEEVQSYKSTLNFVFRVLGCQPLSKFPCVVSMFLKDHIQTGLAAFCCQILVDDQASASVKSRALVMMSYYVAQNNSNQDFLLMLPYVLSALSHAEECVRFGGLLCLDALDKYCYTPEKSKTGESNLKFFYGDKVSMLELPILNAKSLIQYFTARRSELQSSSKFFSTTFESCLNTPLGANKFKKGNSPLLEPFLASVIAHIVAMSHVDGRIALLDLISGIDNKSKLRGLSQVLSCTLKLYVDGTPTCPKLHAFLCQLLDLFTPMAMGSLDAKNPRYINSFVYGLGIEAPCGSSRVAQLVLSKVTPELYASLSDNSQTLLLKALLTVSTGDMDFASMARSIIFNLPLSKSAIQETLIELRSLFLAPEHPAKKMKREPAVIVEFKRPIAQLTVLLDAMNTKDECSVYLGLEVVLFEMLIQLEEASVRPTSTASNYLYQMLLSVLANILNCAQASGFAVSEAGIRADVSVQLLQLPAQPQTHHQALRLLSAIAALFPQKILSYVMPIFTFMGASASKKDDNYSFFIIQETISKIIPPLMQNFQLDVMSESDPVLLAKPLLSVFVNALLSIPQHRRTKLFTILINTMGEGFLYGVLAVILEIYATHHAQGSRDDAIKLRDFCVEIAGQFHPNTQVKSLLQLLNSVLLLPNDKQNNFDPSFQNIYALADHSEKHMRHYKFAVVNFIRETLNQRAFLHQLLEIEAGSEEASLLDSDYINLAEGLLELADSFRIHLASLSDQPVITKFFTQLVGFVYDVLNNVINLLSLPCFTVFLAKLFCHARSTIRYRSIHLLESKLEAYHTQLSEAEIQQFMNLVPTLAQIATAPTEATINRQSALNCLGIYIQCFSHHHGVSEKNALLAHIVPVLFGDHGLASSSWPIFASSCHVASFFCQELSLALVEHIPAIVTQLLNQMEKSFAIDNDALANSVWLSEFVLLESVFAKLAKFTSPYLPQIITQLIAFKGKLTERTVDLALTVRVNSMLDLLHLHLEPRVLLPILFKLYSSISSTGCTATEAFFDILSNVIITLSQEDVEKLYVLLFKFYLECLDFRHFHKEYTQQDVDAVEDIILQSFILLVMKLRDDMFKPIFLKLSEWATQDLKGSPHGRDRLIVFYHLLDLTLSKLKHIFAPYFIYTLDHCIESLGNYTQDSDIDQLWGYLLSSLAYSMQYDTEGVWTIESFNKLLPKLIQQIDLVSDLAVAETSLIPCFDWLCSAVTSESAWKSLNHQVAMKTRHENPTVRCIALKTLAAFYLRQKDAFLPLLPETIPFLAEVMEDDTDLVTSCTRDLILTIERFSGESLDKYFR